MSIEPGTTPATIANGASLSGAVYLGEKTLLGLVMPAAWTAAVITLSVSLDGTTYVDAYDSTGTETSYTVAASRYIALNPANLVGVRYVKLRSGTAASAVNQAAARTIECVVRSI